MKRIAQYILILVVMIGLFSPIFHASAQTIGQCVDNNGVGLPNITFQNCNPPNRWTVTVCFAPEVLQNGQCKPCTPPTVYSVLGGCVAPVSPTLPFCITDRTTGQPINSPCRTISTPTTATITTSSYHLLAPIDIPGGVTDFNPNAKNALGEYLNLMIKIFIGLCAVLAVVMIVMGGIEYMTTELVHTKEAGKERITNALLGLLIALGAYALLNTINPDLLKTDIKIDPTTIQYTSQDVPQLCLPGGTCGGYPTGANWATASGAAALTLPSGVTSRPGECVTVSQPGCTSLYGLSPNYINTIRAGCPTCAPLEITGGTESWLHSVTSSHRPGNPTIDLHETPGLTQYIMGGATQPVLLHRYVRDNISFLYEGNHWHVGP